MAYCRNCGAKLAEGAKFCQKCGSPVSENDFNNGEKRQEEFSGKIYKCPNCGAILHSFVTVCPSCGFELRGTKATSAVREFALKLEAIESKREPGKRWGLFSAVAAQQTVSKTDEQKISLIQSFAVPNTKEDMLEFMILATSNVDLRSYDSTNTNVSKGERELNDAWLSKIKQVYAKAKRSYGNEKDFDQIQDLYDKCKADIRKYKKKGIVKWVLMFAWIPLIFVIIFSVQAIKGPGAQRKEVARMEAIEQEANTALENGEYKKALLNAEGLIYKSSIHNGDSDELERQWDVKRELLIDEILEEAEKHGVYLEYTPSKENDRSNSSSSENK